MNTDIQAIVKKLKSQRSKWPDQAIILGSGWNRVVDDATVVWEQDYASLFGAATGVPGHQGRLAIIEVNGREVLAMAGRFHLYEGYTPQEATLPIHVLHGLGVTQLIVTAAAGAVNPHYQVGDVVIMRDLLTLMLGGLNPLQGAQFQDMSSIFDEKLTQVARQVLVKHSLPFQEGVYGFYHGPNYESRTDKVALRMLGADVLGMSTVPEVLMAKWLKMRVLGLAVVTNLAFVKHDHQEVMAAAEKVSQHLSQILSEIVVSK
jgi:purine-nucleoside phosphorylase